MMKKTLLLAVVTIVAFALLAGLNRFYGSFLPQYSDATVHFEGIATPLNLTMPIYYSEVPLPASVLTISFPMELPKHALSHFTLLHTGNIMHIRVNKKIVSAERFGSADLGGAGHEGTNDVELKLFFGNVRTGIVLGALPLFKNIETLLLAVLKLFVLLLWAFAFRTILGTVLRKELVIFVVLGIAFRSLYVSVTPWYTFSYDAQGHLDYLSYLLTHGSLPIHTDLWQAHQAPLYYLIAVIVPWISSVLHWPMEVTYLNLQAFSLLCSIGMLFVGTGAVLSFFKNRLHRALGVALLSIAPPLVYVASQLSNDVFILFFGILWYAALQRSVDEPRSKQWMLALLWMSLGILSKGNALLWTVPTVSAFLLFTSLPLRERCKRCGFLVLSAPVWGSFFLWRFFSDKAYGLVENAGQLTKLAVVELSLKNVWIFNPVALFLQPYVHSLSSFYRPEYFLESVLRTTQFGSFTYGPVGRYPLLLVIFLLPIFLRGAVLLLRRRQVLPVFTSVFLFLGLAVFCFRYPYSSSQHFRYIAVITLPVILCCVEGCTAYGNRILRMVSEILVGTYVLVTALFYVCIVGASW